MPGRRSGSIGAPDWDELETAAAPAQSAPPPGAPRRGGGPCPELELIPPGGHNNLGGVLLARKGGLAVGIAAAALAGVLLFAYVKQYRHSASSNTQTTTVLVASGYIQKGTPASVVGKKHLYALKQVPVDQVAAGALTDPGSLSTGTI